MYSCKKKITKEEFEKKRNEMTKIEMLQESLFNRCNEMTKIEM